jgi:hypothetical protein
MDIIDKIRFHIGRRKPVEFDLTKLKTITIPLIGPVEVTWSTKSIFSDMITEHMALMYWEGNELYQLEQRLGPACYPLMTNGQPILLSGISYLVKMIELFGLPPSRIFSPWEDMIGFSFTGWVGFRYLVEKAE